MTTAKKWLTISAGAALTLLLCGAGTVYYVFGGKTSERRTETAEAPMRTVKIARATMGGTTPGITYPGRVKAVRHAELFFRVSGPVLERELKYGQTVEKGDVLMRIDPRDYQREADRLAKEVEAQEVNTILADKEYERNAKLVDDGAVSQSAFDAVNTKKRAAHAQLGMLKESLKIARDKLADTVLYAPFHGTVTDLKIEQYEIAKANVPVVVLDDLREVEIRISIPGGYLPDISIHDSRLYLGLECEVTFPGRGKRAFQAKIYEFKPVASETSESYIVLLRMKVPDDFLVLPGMSAEVRNVPRFVRKDGKTHLRIPYAAVFMRDGKSSVWVYHPENGKLERRSVTAMRPEDAASIEVEGDLKDGEWVVAAGGDWLTEQTRVRLLNPEALHEIH